VTPGDAPARLPGAEHPWFAEQGYRAPHLPDAAPTPAREEDAEAEFIWKPAPGLRERIRACADRGGIPALPEGFDALPSAARQRWFRDHLPPGFDEPMAVRGMAPGDWQTVRAGDPFTRLYLDPDDPAGIDPDRLLRHARALRAFWHEQAGSLDVVGRGKRRELVERYAGEDGSERVLQRYVARIEDAHEQLGDRAAVPVPFVEPPPPRTPDPVVRETARPRPPHRDRIPLPPSTFEPATPHPMSPQQQSSLWPQRSPARTAVLAGIAVLVVGAAGSAALPPGFFARVADGIATTITRDRGGGTVPDAEGPISTESSGTDGSVGGETARSMDPGQPTGGAPADGAPSAAHLPPYTPPTSPQPAYTPPQSPGTPPESRYTSSPAAATRPTTANPPARPDGSARPGGSSPSGGSGGSTAAIGSAEPPATGGSCGSCGADEVRREPSGAIETSGARVRRIAEILDNARRLWRAGRYGEAECSYVVALEMAEGLPEAQGQAAGIRRELNGLVAGIPQGVSRSCS
jgi:hypothetical protein